MVEVTPAETSLERRRRLNREARARYKARQRGEDVPLRNVGAAMLPASEFCPTCDGPVPTKTGNGGGHPKRFCSKECKSAWNNTAPERRWRYVRAKYGLSKEDHDALLEAQGGRCAVCRSDDPQFPSWSIDHDHESGAVRGLLCNTCNSGIGLLNDDPELLRAAARYLEQGPQ